MRTLTCDGEAMCTHIVTHLDKRGFLYCTLHGERLKRAYGLVRKLRRWELLQLHDGKGVSWVPKRKPKEEAQP
jgi:hypothetical protein